METKVYYRVRPEHFGYAPEDFENFTDALNKANERNALRPADCGHPVNTVYKGDNCKLQKVTITIEELTV